MKDVDQAVRTANATEYGLVAAIQTGSMERGLEIDLTYRAAGDQGPRVNWPSPSYARLTMAYSSGGTREKKMVIMRIRTIATAIAAIGLSALGLTAASAAPAATTTPAVTTAAPPATTVGLRVWIGIGVGEQAAGQHVLPAGVHQRQRAHGDDPRVPRRLRG